MSKGYTGSKTPVAIRDLWRTPNKVFNYYNKRFNFNLDMAASDENHLCSNYMTIGNSALDNEVFSKFSIGLFDLTGKEPIAWVNPPYSNCKEWVAAVLDYSKKFNAKFVMLLPADTSVKWFKLAFDNCTECHFISGRLAFINEETGKPATGNNKGSVVFVFDPSSPIKQAVSLIDRDSITGA